MIKIKRSTFEKMYNSMPVKYMAQKLGISTTTVYHIIKDMNIKKKGKKQAWKKIIVED